MKAHRKPFFYLISDILPNAKTGGEIVLYRHFVQRNDFDFTIVKVPRKVSGLFTRLSSSRLRTYVHAFVGFFETYDVSVLHDLVKPDFILTVAHGRNCIAALRAARYWNVPLVTIFHDWYPASSDVHPAWQFILDREFVNLHRQSSISFCVSDEMLAALGPQKGAIVLPPIPSGEMLVANEVPPNRPTMLYTGFCGGAYYRMLQECISACVSLDVKMIITGTGAEALGSSTGYTSIRGFFPESEFLKIFESSDILIVLLNFDQRNRKHFSTHFPSKLIEYCGKGKLIGILGPSYATSIRWAKETQGAFYFDQNNTAEFLKKLIDVYHDEQKRNEYIRRATAIFQREYAPDVVHGKLTNAITEVL